jgi:hypothetical protein
LSHRRFAGTLNNSVVHDGFAVERLVPGDLWFQSCTVQVEAGEGSLAVAKKQNLCVGITAVGTGDCFLPATVPELSVSLLRTAKAFSSFSGIASAAAVRVRTAIAKTRRPHALCRLLCNLNRKICMDQRPFHTTRVPHALFCWGAVAIEVDLLCIFRLCDLKMNNPNRDPDHRLQKVSIRLPHGSRVYESGENECPIEEG